MNVDIKSTTSCDNLWLFEDCTLGFFCETLQIVNSFVDKLGSFCLVFLRKRLSLGIFVDFALQEDSIIVNLWYPIRNAMSLEAHGRRSCWESLFEQNSCIHNFELKVFDEKSHLDLRYLLKDFIFPFNLHVEIQLLPLSQKGLEPYGSNIKFGYTKLIKTIWAENWFANSVVATVITKL